MQTRRLISRLFAVAFVIVVLQQVAAVPVSRTPIRAEQRSVRTVAPLASQQFVTAEKILQTWSVTSVSVVPDTEAPALWSGYAHSLCRFQRPPPAA